MISSGREGDPSSGVEIAREIIVQLITLSSAIIVLSGSLLSDTILKGGVQDWVKGTLIASWSIFAVSILLGLLALMSLAGLLARRRGEQPVIYEPIPRLLAIGAVLTFLGGTACFLVYLAAVALGPESLAPAGPVG